MAAVHASTLKIAGFPLLTSVSGSERGKEREWTQDEQLSQEAPGPDGLTGKEKLSPRPEIWRETRKTETKERGVEENDKKEDRRFL